ncbi:hypothetical protein [Aliidiomarina celeris]|uniref:hypothetical protein n=1 Tax=Aliidiomarina celeris TaxID=2249428 RepID=UPI000DEBEB62|nr:hypothetical protein [Aliidiomarina celeris]
MEQRTTTPERWFKRFQIPSPVTGKCLPLSEVDNAALQLGAWGEGVVLAPGNQKIMALPGWDVSHVSEDRRDWSLVGHVQGLVLQLHLRIWPNSPTLPIAYSNAQPEQLFTLSPNVFQGAGSCLISMTFPRYPKLSWQPYYGKVSALNHFPITLYAGAE